MAYTYDDFTSMMKGAGLNESQFSRYDLDLAKSNPNFGIGLISAKKDYMAATTSDARALANADAESMRTKYGNYTGGSTGTSYKPGGPTPSSFKAEAAPTYMPEPAYNNQYSDKQSQLLNDITSYKPFEFNADTNPQMQAYTKQYHREGDRAMQDTLGSLSAATGGMPSTAAVSAAGQANDYYMGQLGDKLPQIYDSEYNKYTNDFNMLNQKAGAVNAQEQVDYSRYWDGKNFNWDKYLADADQSNKNRDFSYGQFTDTINNNINAEQTGYNRQLDAATGAATAEQTAYSRQLDQYNQGQDTFNNQYKIEEFNSNQDTTTWNRMIDLFQASGSINSQEMADYFGLPIGTLYGGALAQLTIDKSKADIELTNANTTDAYASAANRGKTSSGGGGSSSTGAPAADINGAYDRVKANNASGSDLAVLKKAGFTAAELAALQGGGAVTTGTSGDAVSGAMAAFDDNDGKSTQANWDILIAAGYTAQELTDNGYTVNGAAPAGTAAPAAGDTSWLDAYDTASLNKLGMPNITEAQVISIINNPKYASWVGSNGKMFFKLR